VTEAVIFDLDGVIVDSEQVWDEVREQYTVEAGGRYSQTATRAMMGMSSTEWSTYMAEELALPGSPEEINAAIVQRMLARYGEAPPLIDGAPDVVRAIAEAVPVAIASSSNPELIDVVLRVAGLADVVRDAVSSQEVARGKPSPDVYLEAARRLGVDPTRSTAVEDSHNGIRSAKEAGMRVFAVPNPHYPPGDDAPVGRRAYRAYVAHCHHDRIALVEPRAAGVDHHRVRAVLLDRLAHLVAPDRVARDIEPVDDEARDRTERRAELAGSVPAPGQHEVEAEPASVGVVDLREAALAEGVRALGLRQQWQVARQELSGDVVEVVAVQVRHDAAIDPAHDLFGGHRELHERVRDRVRRVVDGRCRACVAKHRVDQEAPPAGLQQQTGVPDERQVHAARPSRTQPLWPPSPIAFESATSTTVRRASFGT
jgi:HAD superfamily hydrolase (TIGR01509 family)